MVSALGDGFCSAGVDVLDRVVLTATGWRHVVCTCCPGSGHPLPAADDVAALEMMAATGSVPAPSRAALAAPGGRSGPWWPRRCERVLAAGGGDDVSAGCVGVGPASCLGHPGLGSPMPPWRWQP
ncbi:hypothetical protein [Actinopolymorpha pittospori]|uniref:hypothetical protein n=1 Tax=Actinopolymorpha pittospori TaxID=648752 RepID=UPI003B58650E